MINLIKDMQSLYTENYKTLMRDVKEHLKKWVKPYVWIGRLNIFKSLILPTLIQCNSNQNSSKHFFIPV